jgi:hypothetical protein
VRRNQPETGLEILSGCFRRREKRRAWPELADADSLEEITGEVDDPLKRTAAG